MSAKITIRLTQAAQRAAVLAGQPAAVVQTYEVDPPLLERLLALPMTVIDTGGNVTCDATRFDGDLVDLGARPVDATAAITEIEAVIGYLRNHKATESARRINAAIERLDDDERSRRAALAVARGAVPEEAAYAQVNYLKDDERKDPRWLAAVEAKVLPRVDAARVELAAEEAEKAEQARRDEEARAEQIRVRDRIEADAVEHCGEADQIGRFRDGVLPASELNALLLARNLPPCAGLAWTPVEPGDLPPSDYDDACEHASADHPRVIVESRHPLTELSAAQWALLRAARAFHARHDAEVMPVREVIECSSEGCSARVRRNRIRVVLALADGREIVRRYDLD